MALPEIELPIAAVLNNDLADHDDTEDGPLTQRGTITSALERWNHPRGNIARVAACFFSQFVIGANDAAYGALTPYYERYYNLQYSQLSLNFLSPLAGYILSAILSNYLHHRVGKRGIALIASSCHLAAYLTFSFHVPFPALIAMYAVVGFGNGIAGAAWNVWIGSLANSNQLLGLLHASYGTGGIMSPLVATWMISRAKLEWYAFFYVMASLAAVELLATTTAFWRESGHASHPEHLSAPESSRKRMRATLLQAPAARVSWLCASFLLVYVGIEVTLGGWIVVFMMKVRDGESFASGMTATGFWLGITVGRVVLGFVTQRLGERLAILIYLPVTLALGLLFWLVPQFYVSAVAVALQGFFLGPLFPATVSATTKLLPRNLHVAAVGFIGATGSAGAALIPFAVGILAQSKGVQVLQPTVIAGLLLLVLLWIFLPRFPNEKPRHASRLSWLTTRVRAIAYMCQMSR